MSRPLRIEYPGAFYHVMNRGAGRKKIFHNDSHFELFFYLLEQAHDKFKIEVHAFCLMNNHYHLLIKTSLPNLSKSMAFINGLYTQKYNKIEKTDGPLFRGRFKAILVEADNYLLTLSRYIHLNPINAKLVKNPENYKWSSYSCYLKKSHCPKWLYREKTLSYFSGRNQITSYIEFVNCGIDSEIQQFYLKKNFPILGSKEFIEKMHPNFVSTSNYENLPENKIISKNHMPTIEHIIEVVANFYHIKNRFIIENSNKTFKNLPRQVAIYLAIKYSGKERREIEKYFKGISYQSLSSASRRFNMKLEKNFTLLQDIENLKKCLSLA